MMRKGLLTMGLLSTLLFFGGCHGYSYMRGSVGYGEASTIPYSQDYYAYSEPPPYYYPEPPYYYGDPYPPYYYYPYPYFFRGTIIFHHHRRIPVSPGPGRRLRSMSSDDSSAPSSAADESPTDGRRFKK